MGSKEAGFDYLGKLQANNVGPSASTGKLTALVNKGELYIANGDLQMNLSQMARNPNVQIFWYQRTRKANAARWRCPIPSAWCRTVRTAKTVKS